MQTNRSLIKYILLTILTLGIYSLFFWHKYVQDVNTLCSNDGKNTNGILLKILFSILTLGIYGLVWQCGMQNRLRDQAGRLETGPLKSGGSVVLWKTLGLLLIGIGPFVGLYIQISSMNTVAYAYQSHMNRRVVHS